ncbi:hypothetical protein FB451DRAFT_1266791, partial [Mycena latifolia]
VGVVVEVAGVSPERRGILRVIFFLGSSGSASCRVVVLRGRPLGGGGLVGVVGALALWRHGV